MNTDHLFCLKKEDIYYTNIEENELQQLTQSALQTASKAKIIKRDKRLNLIKSATDRLKLTEEQTRYIIDAQLREAGWQVDTRNIRYSKGSRPQKNVNMAIAEWPTMTDKKNYRSCRLCIIYWFKTCSSSRS